MLVTEKRTDRFIELLDRLGRMSVDDYYNPYRMFHWPETLPTDRSWMSRRLISIHNTPHESALSEERLRELSILESINFYSLNVHGIRELLIEVVNRVQMPGFELPSEFFHHFIGEENEHMWFFAEFCKRYGHKIYQFPQLKTTATDDHDVENFLVFARILIFEEIVDHYNSHMADDESLHETIRQINRIHHRDESRHIAFGRELVALLFSELQQRLSQAELRTLGDYLHEYMDFCLHSFYSLEVYEEFGIEDPVAFRTALIASPQRREVERTIARKPTSFLRKIGIWNETPA